MEPSIVNSMIADKRAVMNHQLHVIQLKNFLLEEKALDMVD
jgi:hypothetical protein